MILYESEAKQETGKRFDLSDSMANYSQITFIVTLYEENEAVGGVKHNIHVQIASPQSMYFDVDGSIDEIVSHWQFSASNKSRLFVTEKTASGWNNSKIGISKIIGY